MKIEHSPENDKLTTINGGGAFPILLSFPFIGAGLFILSISLGLINQPSPPPPQSVGIPFGGIFLFTGLIIMMGRNGIIMDRTEDLLCSWWGLVIPFHKKNYALSEVSQVHLTKEIRRSKNSSYTVFPVRLAPFEKDLKVSESRDFIESRALAEKVAKFLRVSLADLTQEKQNIRPYHQLDQSVKESLKLKKAIITSPPPTNLGTQIQQRGSELHLTFPQKNRKLILFIVSLVLLFPLFILIPIIPVFLKDSLPLLVKTFTLAVFSLILLGSSSLFLFKRFHYLPGPNSVIINTTKIEINRRNHSELIPMEKAEEILSQKAFLNYKSLTLITDEKLYILCSFMETREADYIHSLILKHIQDH